MLQRFVIEALSTGWYAVERDEEEFDDTWFIVPQQCGRCGDGATSTSIGN